MQLMSLVFVFFWIFSHRDVCFLSIFLIKLVEEINLVCFDGTLWLDGPWWHIVQFQVAMPKNQQRESPFSASNMTLLSNHSEITWHDPHISAVFWLLVMILPPHVWELFRKVQWSITFWTFRVELYYKWKTPLLRNKNNTCYEGKCLQEKKALEKFYHRYCGKFISKGSIHLR